MTCPTTLTCRVGGWVAGASCGVPSWRGGDLWAGHARGVARWHARRRCLTVAAAEDDDDYGGAARSRARQRAWQRIKFLRRQVEEEEKRRAAAAARAEVEAAADAARGAPPVATRAFRVPMRCVPDLLLVWDFTQASTLPSPCVRPGRAV